MVKKPAQRRLVQPASDYAAEAKPIEFIARQAAVFGRRNPWMSYWQSLSDVLLPTQAFFTTAPQPGTEQGNRIYDGTPRLALRDLATTLDGLMKPKSSNWFEVTVEDDDLAEDEDVKRWLEIVHDRMWAAIYHKNARFIQRSGETDLNIACFGWGVLWLQENRNRNGLLFRTFHNSKAAIEENDEGVTDVIAVEEDMTPGQAKAIYERNNKPVPTKITEACANTSLASNKMFRFVQMVLPQEDRLADNLGPRGFPFRSVLLDTTNERLVSESGYREFPAAVPRWETSPGEVYPRSPGMMALPDSRTLQAMGQTLLVGGQRAVDPPIWVVNDAVFSPLRTFPGGVTVVDATDSQGAPVGAFPVSTNIPLGREMQADYRAMVEAAFFKNIFRLPIEGPQMTATEIIERKQEFIRVIGPVFGRLETDYIGHTVERAFAIMDRAGAFPQRPEVMQDVKVTFRFQSPVQQARKQIEIAGLGQAIALLAPLAETQPEIMDNFDGDQIARDAPEWSGVPQRWLRPMRERDERRAQRAQGDALQQTLGATLPLSQAVKNVADAGAALPEV